MDYTNISKTIIDLLGGKPNIKQVSNCMTRVRVVIVSLDKVKKDKLKSTEGVLGVNMSGESVQVIVGPGKSAKIALEINKLLGTSTSSSQLTKEAQALKDATKSKHNKAFQNTLKRIAKIFIPLIPAFIACGLVNGLNSVLATSIGESYTSSAVGQIMTIVGDSVFSLLNIIVGYNAAKEFGGSPIIGAIMGGILSSSALDNISIGALHFQGGRGGVIAVLFVAIAGAYFERLINKKIPDAINVFVTPLITVAVMTVVGLFALQPLAGYISDGIGYATEGIFEHVPYLAGLASMFYLPLVIFGVHHGLIAVNSILFQKYKYYTPLLPVTLTAGAAQVGACLYVYLKTKNKRLKKTTIGSIPVGILGIGEPLIWGVSLPLKRPFIAACLGGFVGGSINAMLGVHCRTAETTGIQAVLLMDPWWKFLIGYGAAIIAGFAFSYLLGFEDSYVPDGKNEEVHVETSVGLKLIKKFKERSITKSKKGNIKFIPYNDKYEKEVIDLWNKNMCKYDQLTVNLFRKLITKNKNYYNDLSLLAVYKNKVVGYIVGFKTIKGKEEKGVIHSFVVDKEFRRKGIATKLIKEMENKLNTKTIVMAFSSGNYMFPGVDYENYPAAIKLIEKLGYKKGEPCSSMYKELGDYVMLAKYKKRLKDAAKKGYKFKLYTNEKINDVVNYVAKEFRPSWAEHVKEAIESGDAKETLTLLKYKNKICGFAMRKMNDEINRFGPLGISESIRKEGLGSLLVEYKMQEMKDQGLDYLFFLSAEGKMKDFYINHGIKPYRNYYKYSKEI